MAKFDPIIVRHEAGRILDRFGDCEMFLERDFSYLAESHAILSKFKQPVSPPGLRLGGDAINHQYNEFQA
ncbi:hypothetical protein BGC_43580 [Burkholderia sp. 3C]